MPTWRGSLLLVLILISLGIICIRELEPFLAITAPVHEGALVVEGWTSDHAMEEVLAQFKREHYDKLYVTGGPIERGAPLSQYKNYAELGAAILVKLGLETNAIQAVPAPWVRQDRTYTEAVSLRDWLRAHDRAIRAIELVTEGPHSRRSRLLYEKAFGPGVKVGIIAISSREYDPRRWWRYSAGVRNVLDEAIAYPYARFLFHPARPEPNAS